MLHEHRYYIKVVVEFNRSILAGGGEAHYDCEQALLQNGSQQSHLCGANWTPEGQIIEYESIINIRPTDGNRSMIIQDPLRRQAIAVVIQHLLGGH
jgi:hypothetical protein